MSTLQLAAALPALAAAVFIATSAVREDPPVAVPARTATPIAATPVPLAVPVRGVTPAQLVDTWGQSREGGLRAHEAIDIPAAKGTAVVAAMPGHVEKLFESARGGITAYVRSHDGRWQTYYAHLAAYAEGLEEGDRIAQGQKIGFVGDTGNAGPGNSHLHFGLHRTVPGEPWSGGAPVNPYPILAGKRQPR